MHEYPDVPANLEAVLTPSARPHTYAFAEAHEALADVLEAEEREGVLYLEGRRVGVRAGDAVVLDPRRYARAIQQLQRLEGYAGVLQHHPHS